VLELWSGFSLSPKPGPDFMINVITEKAWSIIIVISYTLMTEKARARNPGLIYDFSIKRKKFFGLFQLEILSAILE